MQAQAVAKKLKAQGVNVISFEEGNELEDGFVRVSDLVHVSVPTYGRGLNVVQLSNGGRLMFKPKRTSIESLVNDIRASLGMCS